MVLRFIELFSSLGPLNIIVLSSKWKSWSTNIPRYFFHYSPPVSRYPINCQILSC